MANTQPASVIPGNTAADQVNQNFLAMTQAMQYGRRFGSGIGGLVFGYYGATLQDGTAVADGTVTVGASTTTYFVVNRSTGAVSSSTGTTNWNNTTDYMRMCVVVSGSTGVTSYADHRPSGGLSAGGSGGGAVDSVNGQTGTVVLALGDLDDVDTAGAANGDILTFDGTDWTPQPNTGGAAWGSISGTLSSQTDLQAALDAKAPLSPRVQAVTSSSTVTPTFSDDAVKITAQAAALTLANPTGTPVDMAGMVIRIKDNGTARSISYGTQYRAIGVTLPTTTVIGKTVYLAMVYNSEDTTWDVVAVGQQA